MTDFFTHHGLPLLFVVVMVESFGVPLPGETALIAFGVLASRWLNRYSDRVLPRVESLMERHGGKMVFSAASFQFCATPSPGSPVCRACVGGGFLVWNAAGGIVWATAVGLTAYYAGQAAANAIQRYGLYAGSSVVVAVVVGWFGARYVRRRVEERL